MNAITLSGTVSAATEFNYYVPVKIKATAFTYAFIGLLSTVSPPTVSGVYRIFGSNEGNLNYGTAAGEGYNA